jgi:aspartate/methionine/tyrosine aminotransferase
MRSVYGVDSDLKEADVAITAGCNMAYAAAIMSLAGQGDEVILPVPWYVYTSHIPHNPTQHLSLGTSTISGPSLPRSS